MIKKKYIYRFLALGLIFNNLFVVSNANSTEILSRYETLEGEYITIDDSEKGELYEIDVFGNTVQDENNLGDIQSVGDLYVDKNGSPILDAQGRNQYKINVISKNTVPVVKDEWLSSINKELSFTNRYTGVNFSTSGHTKSGDTVELYLKIKKISEPNNFVNPIAITSLDSGGYNQNFITNSEWLDLPVGESIERTLARVITKNTGRTYISLQVGQVYENQDPTSNTGTFIIEDVRIDIIPSDNNIQEKKIEMLLPTQLQKLGDVSDRLYWDNKEGRYIIEKNIGICNFDNKIVTANFNTTDVSGYKAEYLTRYQLPQFNVKDGLLIYNSYLSDRFLIRNNNPTIEDICIKMGSNDLRICIKNELFDSLTMEEVRNLFLGASIYYPMKDMEIIETNITSKIKVPTYEGRTYIYIETENEVKPTLKVTVDRLTQVAKKAVENAQLNPTVENISIARMYVNILSESGYKDQLNEELNEVFSADIKLDKKTVSSNVDVYFKFENMLLMSLSTNSITFEDYSDVDNIEMQKAIGITINSSLPYQLNAYLIDEIYNSDKTKKIDIDRLEIKESKDIEYKPFMSINNKVVLEDDCESGNNKFHIVDLKLKGGNAYEADVYKTTIKFEAEQK